MTFFCCYVYTPYTPTPNEVFCFQQKEGKMYDSDHVEQLRGQLAALEARLFGGKS